MHGNWQDKPIAIDGNLDDWPSPLPYYDEKSTIAYDVTNDRDNVYIIMKASDVQLQRKIMRAGMKVWIDSSGKKEQSTYINYPLESSEPMRTMQGEGAKPNPAERKKRMEDHLRNIVFAGFDGCNGSFLVAQTNSCDIHVSIGYDDFNQMIWEASIPIKSFYKKISHKEDGKVIAVCFEIEGIKRTGNDGGEGAGRGGGSGGMRGGGGGMRGGGGGMRGGGGGGMRGGGNRPAEGSQQQENMTETTKTWFKTGLVYK